MLELCERVNAELANTTKIFSHVAGPEAERHMADFIKFTIGTDNLFDELRSAKLRYTTESNFKDLVYISYRDDHREGYWLGELNDDSMMLYTESETHDWFGDTVTILDRYGNNLQISSERDVYISFEHFPNMRFFLQYIYYCEFV